MVEHSPEVPASEERATTDHASKRDTCVGSDQDRQIRNRKREPGINLSRF